jgi:hypothetical protein
VIYTVTLSYRFTPTATLDTGSAVGALDFYSRPSRAWPITATIERDGKPIGVDALIRDAINEGAEPLPI